MKRLESIKRIMVLWLSFVGLLFHTAVYAYVWFNYYYPAISKFTARFKFYKNGHLLILGIYFVLLFFFFHTYGGLKVGYLKPMEIFFSQFFSLLFVNIITYLQISLMNNWLVQPEYFVGAMLVQLLIAAVWIAICNLLYRKVFPPRKMLLIYGERSIDDILRKFASRKDKYNIVKCLNISEGIDKIEQEISDKYGAVVLWDIPTADRNKLLKFCYGRSMRVYMMPKIPDVLVQGSDQLHLFDTPILLTREYALTVEQRITKRLIDIVCALILVILTSPIMLITAICIKCYDKGPVLYKQVRCTMGGKEFWIMKFRSMRVDAEKDGVARLASKNDNRITPIGKFIRAVRIDELPQLFNILSGDMSFIGPRPERPEIIKQYVEEMPEFVFRMKVKAGLAGYAQVYGKYNTTPYDKLKLDLSYIENYSVWLDIKLMLLTLKILIQAESTEGVESSQVTAMKASDKAEE
ncbi:MAG: exopolysaccharide biosynthesis polyprenyl glycosylphosphotransferase [Lachnospiraceae bacterium]|nr:exopolysaccharide biosynthesis polyprenyl glycosylphosphotransferase [Lachnospiraceae bacterium]